MRRHLGGIQPVGGVLLDASGRPAATLDGQGFVYLDARTNRLRLRLWDEDVAVGGSGGVTSHDALSALTWTGGGHTDDALATPIFDGSGDADIVDAPTDKVRRWTELLWTDNTTRAWALPGTQVRRAGVNVDTALAQWGTGAPSTTGTATNINVNDRKWMQYAAASGAGSSGSVSRTGGSSWFRRAAGPIVRTVWLRVNAAVGQQSAIRLTSGFTSALNTNSDTAAGHFAGVAYSTVRGDPGLVIVTRDGTTQTVGSTVASFAWDTVYLIVHILDGSNYTVQVNGGTVYQTSTTLPGSTTDVGWADQLFTTDANVKNLQFGGSDILYTVPA